jgi:membrane-associated phospholipid phosphatase
MRRTVPVALVATLWLPSAAHAAALSDYEIGIVRGANSLGAPYLDAPMGVLSNEFFTVLAPAGMAVAADRGGTSGAVLVLSSEILSFGVAEGLKEIFRRPRPYVSYPDLRTPQGPMPNDPFSFPSGHAAVSFAAATALADWNGSWAIPAYALAALISYSRMYNGMHYLSDLALGAGVGYGAAKLTRWGIDRLQGRYGFPALGVSPTFNLTTGPMVGFSANF